MQNNKRGIFSTYKCGRGSNYILDQLDYFDKNGNILDNGNNGYPISFYYNVNNVIEIVNLLNNKKGTIQIPNYGNGLSNNQPDIMSFDNNILKIECAGESRQIYNRELYIKDEYIEDIKYLLMYAFQQTRVNREEDKKKSTQRVKEFRKRNKDKQRRDLLIDSYPGILEEYKRRFMEPDNTKARLGLFKLSEESFNAIVNMVK